MSLLPQTLEQLRITLDRVDRTEFFARLAEELGATRRCPCGARVVDAWELGFTVSGAFSLQGESARAVVCWIAAECDDAGIDMGSEHGDRCRACDCSPE